MIIYSREGDYIKYINLVLLLSHLFIDGALIRTSDILQKSSLNLCVLLLTLVLVSICLTTSYAQVEFNIDDGAQLMLNQTQFTSQEPAPIVLNSALRSDSPKPIIFSPSPVFDLLIIDKSIH